MRAWRMSENSDLRNMGRKFHTCCDRPFGRVPVPHARCAGAQAGHAACIAGSSPETWGLIDLRSPPCLATSPRSCAELIGLERAKVAPKSLDASLAELDLAEAPAEAGSPARKPMRLPRTRPGVKSMAAKTGLRRSARLPTAKPVESLKAEEARS